MSQQAHNVLLASACTETTDRLFELFEQCDSGPLRIIVSRDPADAENQLEHRDFMLAIFDLGSFVTPEFMSVASARLNPMPAIALTSEGTAEVIISALRSGADDVFLSSDLDLHPELFVESMKRQLKRAFHIVEAKRLRESLERSLDELRADHRAAQQVQQNLLPPKEQIINGIRFEYTLTPSLLLSGDFVDAITVNEHQVLFYLADISGHGASSALVTVLLKNMTHRLLRNYKRHSSFDILSPIATLERINRELLLTGLGKHLTMFIGLIDTKSSKLTYAVGGHHPMPVFHSQDYTGYLEGRGMPAGLFESPTFEQREVQLPQAFALTLFSDGILEIINGYSLKDKEENILQLLKGGFVSSFDLSARLIKADASNPDDVAIMTVSRV